MIRRTGSILTATVIALAACAKQAAPPVDLAAEEQAVRAASANWAKSVQAKDWAAAAASFAPDGMSFPENREPLTGPAAVQAASEAEAAAMPNATVSWTTDKVIVAASGDMALEIGSWTMTNGAEQDVGKYITVWRKLEGQWKAAADMGVSTKPEVEETKK